MIVKNLTMENFQEEVLESEVPVIIDFYADWCGPCKMLKPVFEKISEEYKGRLNFARLNTENEEMIAMQFEIQGIPALVIVNGKKEVGRIVGYMGEEQLKSRIDHFLEKI
ncbi:MAG: thioredoxin [Nanoarchaeota archaeon]|nr:thioredoxin [Nanoarchaeota archaeon]